MSIFLQNAAMLAGLACVALPILIHLIMRERPRLVEIPTARFVRMAIQRSHSARQLRNILLLLLRIAVIALIVFAMARPIWRNSPFGQTYSEQAAMVLLVDDAFYSASATAGISQIDRARREASRVFQRLTPGSKAAVGTLTDPPTRLSVDLPFVAQAITGLTPRNLLGNANSAIRQAAEILRRDAPDLPRRIVLISDLNQHVTSADYVAPEGCTLEIVALAPRKDNAYILAASAAQPHAIQGQPLSITAQVGGVIPPGTRIALENNGEVVARRGVADSATITFDYVPDTEGDLALTLRLETEDALPADNVWHLVLPVQPSRRILIIGEAESSTISTAMVTRLALAPNAWSGRQLYEVKMSDCRFPVARLPLFDMVVFCAEGACQPELWTALESFVGSGGALLVLPDPAVDLERLQANGMRLLPARIAVSHDAEKLVAIGNRLGGQWLLLGRAELVTQTYGPRLHHPPSDREEATLGFGDGSIAISQRSVGKGNVLFCGVPVLAGKHPLYASEIWPALLHRMVASVLPAQEGPDSTFCGELVVIEDIRPAHDGLTVHTPNGPSARFPLADLAAGLHFDAALRPGHYRLQGAEKTTASWFAVNIPRNVAVYRFPELEHRKNLTKRFKEQKGSAQSGGNLPLSTAALAFAAIALFIEPVVAGRRRSDA